MISISCHFGWATGLLRGREGRNPLARSYPVNRVAGDYAVAARAPPTNWSGELGTDDSWCNCVDEWCPRERG